MNLASRAAESEKVDPPIEALVQYVLLLPLALDDDVDSEIRTARFFGESARCQVDFLKGNPVKIRIESGDVDNSTRTMVFLTDSGDVESVRTWFEVEKIFSNGVRRGPDMRKLLCQLNLRQDFAPNGMAKDLGEDFPESVAGLFIHSKSFVGGVGHESANTFLGYAFDADGVLPAGDRIADVTHFFGKERVHITETRHRTKDVSEFLEIAPSELFAVSTAVVTANNSASEGKLPYLVELFESEIRVSMAGELLAVFPVSKTFDAEEAIRSLSVSTSPEISPATTAFVLEGVKSAVSSRLP